MKYFLIAGEASGDLHAANLMRALQHEDAEAEFRFYGGDHMQAVGGEMLCHYKHLAYMGVVPVLMHLRAILGGMRRCKEQICQWQPDVVILVDYPGFNLSIAKFVHAERICPVFYYISPKIWAWKEGRIRRIRRDVDALYSILPFEVPFFEEKHHYPVTYVGNPTVDEVDAFLRSSSETDEVSPGDYVALLPGSRRQEVTDNLRRMLQAAAPVVAEKGLSLRIAVAPAMPIEVYEDIIRSSGVQASLVELVAGRTYELLARAQAALVTSGTATLETALFRVPQVVCYYIGFGPFVRLMRRLFLKVKYISLVNLICDEEVVPELVADAMNVRRVRAELLRILPGGEGRAAMLEGYERMASRLGEPGAPEHAARAMVRALSVGIL
ncbi:MAG: lipid-A-disaccharide synthase [Alloprevotella sp.]|nr:lipid-A-disaccharide synthase [Alloprevotella sp.]